MKKRTLMVRGQTCRFLEAGLGSPLILIASPLVLATCYRKLIVSLGNHHRVIAVELPGAGFSSRIESPWGFTQYAHWMAAFMDMLEIPSATVIGHSNSGAVAAWLARLYPERVSRLILADSIGIPRGSLWRILLARGFDALLELRLTLTGFHQLVYNTFAHTINFIHQLRIAPRYDMREALAAIRVPTLIAWGGRDHTLPRELAQEMQRLVPNASYSIFAEGSHDWMITHSAEFEQVVNTWDGRANQALLSQRPAGPPKTPSIRTGEIS